MDRNANISKNKFEKLRTKENCFSALLLRKPSPLLSQLKFPPNLTQKTEHGTTSPLSPPQFNVTIFQFPSAAFPYKEDLESSTRVPRMEFRRERIRNSLPRRRKRKRRRV